jgi:hypothetical protein
VRILFLILTPFLLKGQQDSASFFTKSEQFNKKRFNAVVITEAVAASASLIALNQLWYKDYPHSSFHFFDDNDEWLQMDKIGHHTTAYCVGRVGIGLMKWSGVEHKRAAWYGGTLGLAYLTTVEIFDGFSSAWGFSAGDMTANTLGAGMVIAQELGWKEQRITVKFSYHPTKFADFRPNQLGSNTQERIIKDYNGQTYWLSGNIYSFLNKESRFPKWLNIAVGYGAEGMTGARENILYDKHGSTLNFERYRQYYFSLDIDLSKLVKKPGFLKALAETIGFIKFPAPAIEFNKKVMKFHSFYF